MKGTVVLVNPKNGFFAVEVDGATTRLWKCSAATMSKSETCSPGIFIPLLGQTCTMKPKEKLNQCSFRTFIVRTPSRGHPWRSY